VIIVIRRDDPEVKELFDSIDKMRVDFESIERPTLEIELPEEKVIPSVKLQKTSSRSEVPEEKVASPKEKSEKGGAHASESASPKSRAIKSPKSAPGTAKQQLDTESELAKLEQAFGEASRDYTTDEIGGWEFDELEQELRSSYPEGNNK